MQAQAGLQARALGNYPTATETRITLLEDVHRAICAGNEKLNEACRRLETIHERLVGAVPTASGNVKSADQPPNSMIERLRRANGDTESMHVWLSNVIERLEAL